MSAETSVQKAALANASALGISGSDFTHEQGATPSASTSGSADTPHAKHQWVIIDSQSTLPAQDGGYDVVRFHRNAATEATDAINTFGAQRSVQSNAVAHTSWHPVQLQGPAHEVGSSLDAGNLPMLQVFDGSGERRFAAPALAQAHSQRVLGALELGNKAFTGRGAVRQMAAGHRFTLTKHEHYPEGSNAFTVLSVRHAAINNLNTNVAASPLQVSQASPDGAGTTHTALLATLERGTYRNTFTCVRQTVPILPAALAQRSAPTVLGTQTALVVGLPEATLTTDRDHRVQVQFAWQRGASANAQQGTSQGVCVRVAEAQARPNWGTQFTPRIGGEVLVDFVEGDIDRPVVVAQLYNGADQPPFAAGVDAGTNHAGTISGWHSQEVAAGEADAAGGGESSGGSGGSGYNQWVLDDSTGQLRMRLASSGAASQLNLGHLVSQSPSSAQRGNYRGSGFELRSDAWGTVRGAQGVLLSSSARTQSGTSVQSTQMDMAEAVAQLQSAKALTQALSDAASQQQALHSVDAAKAHTSSIAHTDVAQDGKHAATVNGQEARKTQAGARSLDATAQGAVERFKTPWVVMEGPSHVHWASPASTLVFAGEQLHSSTQGDSHWAAGHTWSSVSANANTLFSHSGGIQAFAGNGPVSVQAHTDALELLADKDITIVSVNDEISINANSKITLQAGQSAIVLEGANITFTCPGTFTAKGSSHPFGAGGSSAAAMAKLPDSRVKLFDEAFILIDKNTGMPLANYPYKIKRSDNTYEAGVTDEEGRTHLVTATEVEHLSIEISGN
jgi:type VI secretion system secreted protein VgrG